MHRHSPCHIVVVILLAMTQSAHAAPIDEFRISDIEQQMRNLQSTVREQARQIAALQQRDGRSNNTPSTNATATAADNSKQRWLSVSNWQKLKSGMSELQVLEILGAPTQIRNDTDGNRQLLYAMEIGRSGFLSGRVVTQSGAVKAIELPTLR
jgi:hypothetical protein